MGNDDCIALAERCDVVYDEGGVPVERIGSAVYTFGGEGFEEHETDFGDGVDTSEGGGGGGGEECVVGEILDACAVCSGAGTESGKGGDKGSVTSGAGTTADIEGADVEAGLEV